VTARCSLLLAVLLSGWAVSGSVSAVTAGQAPAGVHAGDLAQGKELFTRRCGGCHSLDQDKEGPRLGTVYGRKAGSVAGFDYSEALKESAIVWDERTLDQWLTDTAAMVPKSDMAFRVPKPEDRVAIIAFLKSTAAR
jgi:cytochrome c